MRRERNREEGRDPEQSFFRRGDGDWRHFSGGVSMCCHQFGFFSVDLSALDQCQRRYLMHAFIVAAKSAVVRGVSLHLFEQKCPAWTVFHGEQL